MNQNIRGVLFFAGTEFPPVIDKMVLQDKTIIDFWFKEPDVMLKHQINNVIKQDQIQHVSCFDLLVGGDHSGRKFRMTLKILFRFHESSTSTVLNPIGQSLRRISHGGHFIVYSDTNDSFGLTFNFNVSCALTNTCKILCIAVILHLVSFYFQENVNEQSLVCNFAWKILILGESRR